MKTCTHMLSRKEWNFWTFDHSSYSFISSELVKLWHNFTQVLLGSSETTRLKPVLRRRPFTDQEVQVHVLHEAFLEDSYPSHEKQLELAESLNMTVKKVKIWFDKHHREFTCRTRKRTFKIEFQLNCLYLCMFATLHPSTSMFEHNTIYVYSHLNHRYVYHSWL